MKKIDELKKALTVEFCDIEFSFHGKSCGVESVVIDGYVTYDIWCGDELETYNSADDLLNATLFGGKSLRQIAEQIDFFYI